MAFNYVVLGAGMQGVAAAYDFAKFGEAEQVTLVDTSAEMAAAGSERINRLLGTSIVRNLQADVKDGKRISEILSQADVCLSAVPYFFNEELTKLAIEAACSFCDLGGNTEVVFRQHDMSAKAEAAGVTIAPDCGLAPGMANVLAAHGIRRIENPQKALIRVGGLPQEPKPPLGYSLVFSMEGLSNEYFGKAHVLRRGQRVEVETFTELEKIEFPPPFGICEAFMTAGGTSTCPWTFEGKVQEFDEKTIRYPGHFEKMKAVHEMGLLNLEPVKVGDQEVVPRQLFHAVVEPLLKTGDPRDVVLLRVTVTAQTEQMVFELIDYYDEKTGFTAMQRTTGWGAAIVGIMMAKGGLLKGSVRIEEAVDSARYIEQMQKRGFDLQVTNLT